MPTTYFFVALGGAPAPPAGAAHAPRGYVYEAMADRKELTTCFSVRGGCIELGEVPWCEAVQAFVNQQAQFERDTTWRVHPV